jgi:hypothetical protein
VELGENKFHGRSFNFSGLGALRNLEGLKVLESLEGLEGLRGLESLKALEGLEGLEGLRSLEELEGIIELNAEGLSERLSALGERFGNGFLFQLGDDDFDSEQLEEQLSELSERLGEMKFDIDVPHISGNYNFNFVSSRPKLGVQLVTTTRELREHLGGSEDSGVLVSKVLSGMPAEAAGVQVGDLIMSVDGQSVGNSGDLIEALSDRSGDTVELEVLREGRTIRLDVELEEARSNRDRSSRSNRRHSHNGSAATGISQNAQAAYGAALKVAEAAAAAAQSGTADPVLMQYRQGQSQTIDLSDTF